MRWFVLIDFFSQNPLFIHKISVERTPGIMASPSIGVVSTTQSAGTSMHEEEVAEILPADRPALKTKKEIINQIIRNKSHYSWRAPGNYIDKYNLFPIV